MRAIANIDHDWVATHVGGLRNLILRFDTEVAQEGFEILADALITLAEEDLLGLRKMDNSAWYLFEFDKKNIWHYTKWFFYENGFEVKLKHKGRRRLSAEGYTPQSAVELNSVSAVDLSSLKCLVPPSEALPRIDRLILEGEGLLEEPSTAPAMIQSTEKQRAWTKSGDIVLKQSFGTEDLANRFANVQTGIMPADAGIQPKWKNQSEQTHQRIAILRSIRNALNTAISESASMNQDKKIRSPRDQYPEDLAGVRQDIDYWATRQGEGHPDSPWEVGVGNRLTHLRELEQRLLEQERNTGIKPSNNQVFNTALNTYSVIKQRGQGGSATVYEVRDPAEKRYALKAINKASSSKIDRFKNELSFCLRNQHPNIVSILDYGINASNENLPFYVMELYPKTLRDLITDRIAPDRVLFLFYQILDGVEAAHGKDVCHRDIKPENILYDPTNNKLVVADFGIARFKEDELWAAVQTDNRERLANFRYSAPEQRKPGGTISKSVDIYALGLILNEMFTGEIPQGTQFKHIGECSAPHAYLDNVVDQMIRQNPEQRPAIEVFRPFLSLNVEEVV